MSRRTLPLLCTLALIACGSDGATTSTTSTTSSVTAATAAATTMAPSAASDEGIATTTVPITAEDPCGHPVSPPSRYEHVIWIWMENHRADQVIGTSSAPSTTRLVAQCGTASDYLAVGSPSLPNYIGATSGDTWGIHDDKAPATHRLTVDNLFRQVREAGGTAVSYQESMPGPCTLTSADPYAVKHNPAAYYQGSDDRAACERDNLPLGTPDAGRLHDALAAGTLPTFSFVTPDLCNDTHDCPVATGDRWLAGWMAVILDSAAYREGSTAVFVVWDEDEPMPFVAVAPSIPHGAVVTTQVDHYALLRTTEELLGIGELLGRAAGAPSLRAALQL